MSKAEIAPDATASSGRRVKKALSVLRNHFNHRFPGAINDGKAVPAGLDRQPSRTSVSRGIRSR